MAGKNAQERWNQIAEPHQADIVRGAVALAMSLGLSPEDAGRMLVSLSNQEANDVAEGVGGVPDGQMLKQVGTKLRD